MHTPPSHFYWKYKGKSIFGPKKCPNIYAPPAGEAASIHLCTCKLIWGSFPHPLNPKKNIRNIQLKLGSNEEAHTGVRDLNILCNKSLRLKTPPLRFAPTRAPPWAPEEFTLCPGRDRVPGGGVRHRLLFKVGNPPPGDGDTDQNFFGPLIFGSPGPPPRILKKPGQTVRG